MKKHFKKIITAIVSVTALCIGALYIYSADYYRADSTAVSALQSSEAVSVETADNMTVFRPKSIEAGFIFYPGGKVEYTAYAPLMQHLAKNNIACVITKMPFNLAVMDINAADKAAELLGNVDKLYIGGHSLGGSMASAFLDKSDIAFDGLILLASYSTADLTDNSIDVLSVYGSKDGVLNMESYTENIVNLPDDTTEIVIDGGNHAQFGCYGVQDGDGNAEISADEQLKTTAEAIIDFIKQQ